MTRTKCLRITLIFLIICILKNEKLTEQLGGRQDISYPGYDDNTEKK